MNRPRKPHRPSTLAVASLLALSGSAAAQAPAAPARAQEPAQEPAEVPAAPAAPPAPAGELTAGAAPGPAAAATPAAATPAAPIQEITVSGTRVARLRDESPAAISIVTRQDLKKRHVLTFDESLRREPGVFVLKYRQPVDNHTITVMRGLTGQSRTLAMLDGIPLNGVAGGEIPWANLPVDGIERIEVGRGPFSALYGGHAMAGVVHATTATPQTATTVLRAGYGSHASHQLTGFHGTRLHRDKVSVLVGIERYASAGYEVQQTRKAAGATPASPDDPVVSGWIPSTDVTGQPQYIIGTPGKNALSRDTYIGKIGYDLAPRSTLTLLGLYGQWSARNPSFDSYLRDASGAPILSGSVNIDGRRIALSEHDFSPIERDQQAALAGARLVHALGERGTLSATLAVTQQASEEVELRAVPAAINPTGRNWTTRRTESRGVHADAGAALRLGARNTLTAGVTAAAARGDQSIPLIVGRHERTVTGSLARLGARQLTGALYAQDELRLGDALRVYGGLRLDLWRNEGGFRELPASMPGAPAREELPARVQTSANPKVSVVYLPAPGTTLRASAGTAFRAPTITELYGGTAHAGTQTFGNPDLRPERIRSLELGAVKRLGPATRAAATVFQNDIDRLVFARTVSAPGAPVTVRMQENAAEVRAQGVELELRHGLARGLDVFGNYTFTRSRFRAFPANPAAEGKRLPNVPAHMFNTGLELRAGALQGLVTVEGVSDAFAREDNSDVARGVPQGIDPYVVVDAKVGYQITRQVRASVAGQNLLDADYFLGFGRSPGRTFFAETALAF